MFELKNYFLEQIFGIKDFLVKQIITFVSTDSKYYMFMALAVVLYFVFKKVISKIYKENKKKMKFNIFNIKIIAMSVIIGSFLEIYGFHNKQIIYVLTIVSFILVTYSIGGWMIFNKFATIHESKIRVKDEDLIEKLNSHINSSNIQSSIDFKFNGNKYIFSGEETKVFRIFTKVPKTNKTVRLYEMFLALALFFIGLIAFAYIFGSYISKDSMVYGVLLLFGAAFILPYLQDVKHTIRFANNKYLTFDAFASFYINGNEVFGRIIDMNLYEVILMDHWSKTKKVISHNEIKTFTVYDEGRFIELDYVVSGIAQDELLKLIPDWIVNEYDKKNPYDLPIITFYSHNYGYGVKIRINVNVNFLEKYGRLKDDLEHLIVNNAKENKIDLRTPVLESNVPYTG